MAGDNRRERILVYLVGRVESLQAVVTVKRQPQSETTLEEFMESDFPVVAVVGGFPVPQETKWSGRQHSVPDLFISRMPVEIYYYDRVDQDPDTRISDIADDLWRIAWEDTTVDDEALRMEAAFVPLPQYRHPYVAFKLDCTITYKHTRGGI